MPARVLAALLAAVLLTGCREVRVNQLKQGTTTVLGPPQVVVIRDPRALRSLGVEAPQVRFSKEFAVVLLMGEHRATGWSQIVESIRANSERVRVVAFERGPLDGGEPTPPYRIYTLWIVPNSVYRRGSLVTVVTPSGDRVAETVLR